MPHVILFALLSSCECAIGEGNVLYGGGELVVELVSDGGLSSGTWVVPGMSQEEVDRGDSAVNLALEGGSHGQLVFIGLGKNHWVLSGYAELGEAPVDVDDCGGRAEYLVFEASPDAAEAHFTAGKPGPLEVLEPDDPAFDPSITAPTLTLTDIDVDAARRGVSGEVHASVQARSTAPECEDPDLGSAELVVTWALDKEVRSRLTSCEVITF